MEKSIRVRVLGREYALRVRAEDEDLTRDMAAYVDAKMQAFHEAHPEQQEVTVAVITAMALAEELYASWEQQDRHRQALDAALDALDRRLAHALAPSDAPPVEAPEPAPQPEEAQPEEADVVDEERRD